MSSFVKVLQTLIGLTIIWVILLASTISFSSTETYRSSTLEKIHERKENPAKRNIFIEIDEEPKDQNSIEKNQIEENHKDKNYEESSKEKEKYALQFRIEKNRAFCENIKQTAHRVFVLFGKSSGNIGFKTCLVAKAASTTLTMASLLGMDKNFIIVKS